ncbi:MAG: hypothetical protein WAU88_04780, partial [Candidatus Zixiibacteriota bacterium]
MKFLGAVSHLGFLTTLLLVALTGMVYADQVADPSDWPMYMYNAQHTGFNDFSSLKPPLDLKWWSRPFDSAGFLNEVVISNGSLV